MIALYGLAIRRVLSEPWGSGVEHSKLALVGLMVGTLVSILTGALSIGYDRRKGTIQALLASGVAAEDIVRARMAALLLRALHFMGPPAIHLAIVVICARLAPPAELLWRIPAVVSGLVLATILMMDVTFDFAVSYRRPEVAGLMAVLLGIPAGIFVVGFIGATVPTFAIGLPLIIAGLCVSHAKSIQKLQRRLFN
jgi:hypothetical protein